MDEKILGGKLNRALVRILCAMISNNIFYYLKILEEFHLFLWARVPPNLYVCIASRS